MLSTKSNALLLYSLSVGVSIIICIFTGAFHLEFTHFMIFSVLLFKILVSIIIFIKLRMFICRTFEKLIILTIKHF